MSAFTSGALAGMGMVVAIVLDGWVVVFAVVWVLLSFALGYWHINALSTGAPGGGQEADRG